MDFLRQAETAYKHNCSISASTYNTNVIFASLAVYVVRPAIFFIGLRWHLDNVVLSRLHLKLQINTTHRCTNQHLISASN